MPVPSCIYSLPSSTLWKPEHRSALSQQIEDDYECFDPPPARGELRLPSAWTWAWAVAALTNRTQLSWCYARSRVPAPRYQQLPPLLSGAALSGGFKRSWKKPSTPEVTTLETTRVGTIVGSPNRAQHSSHPHGGTRRVSEGASRESMFQPPLPQEMPRCSVTNCPTEPSPNSWSPTYEQNKMVALSHYVLEWSVTQEWITKTSFLQGAIEHLVIQPKVCLLLSSYFVLFFLIDSDNSHLQTKIQRKNQHLEKGDD